MLIIKIFFVFIGCITLGLMSIGIHYVLKHINRQAPETPEPFKGIYSKGYPVNKYGLNAEVFEKLVALGAYEKWEKNVENDPDYKGMNAEQLYNNIHYRFCLFGVLYSLIYSSFMSDETPEGRDYWDKISKS